MSKERETERERGCRFLDLLLEFGGCAIEGAVALNKSVNMGSVLVAEKVI